MFRRLVTGSVQAGVEILGERPAMVVRSVSTLRRGALSVEDGETIRVAAASALDVPDPVRDGAGVERRRRVRGSGLAARLGSGGQGHHHVLGHGAGRRGGDRPRAVGSGPAPRARRSGGDDGRCLRLRLGSGHGRGVHRGADRYSPARGDGHACPLQRVVCHRVGHRGGGHGPRGAPVEPAARPCRRAAPSGRRADRPSDRTRSRPCSGTSSRPGPPAPTTSVGWPRHWPTTRT